MTSLQRRVDNPARSPIPQGENNRTRREVSSPNPSETHPLVENLPPMAGPETDDSDDGREVVNKPYPGVDDGFFDVKDKEPMNPDGDNFPKEDDDDGGVQVQISSRAGTDDDDGTQEKQPPDENDGVNNNKTGIHLHPNGHRFYAPGFEGHHDPEVGSVFPEVDLDSTPDVNVYQHKKTLAQGMMDLALFSANANQLRYVLESSSQHPYYVPSLVLISISLIFQVAVGIGLIWNATYNVMDKKEICVANKINNFTVIGIFLVTVVNVFISAFGVASPQATGTT